MSNGGVEFGPEFGLAIGHRRAAGSRYHISPEFFARAGGSVGAFVWLAGVQVPFGR